ncbi:FkbM family methyltransferase [Pedobacter yonginense]|nr:FkbM family methyltransferase [Pedobacter yonginense]
MATPLNGNFKINCDTSTWIGAKIRFTGDYEPELKSVFKAYIKKGDTVIDVGANIGFHTLYFAELTGNTGKVIAFEPVQYNFKSLLNNISLNKFANIHPHNVALSNKAEEISIHINEDSVNPGAFNLFETGKGTVVKCEVGDDVLNNEHVNFIKIDVEGYESFVIEGLKQTIKKHKPYLIFEFDRNYQQKTGLPPSHIFDILTPLGYSFFAVTNKGLVEFDLKKVKSCNVFAKPNLF